jgi:hypothetical protein
MGQDADGFLPEEARVVYEIGVKEPEKEKGREP